MKYQNYDITIAVTRRCNARCIMCNQWAIPTVPGEEIDAAVLARLPQCKFVQITGGEPFVRKDIEQIVSVLRQRAKRVLINTNGYYTDRIRKLACKYPDVAFRISIDGEKETHNRIRGIDIFDRAMDTLAALKKVGIRDLGISYTLQETNYEDLLSSYHRALDMGVGFSCTVVHNSFYFDKKDNEISHTDNLQKELQCLVKEELRSSRKKDWVKAFMNDYNIRYMNGDQLPVKCDAGVTSFYLDALGNVLPCNMTPEPWLMGNLKKQTWDEIIHGAETEKIIIRCKNCKIQCWSMCNVRTSVIKHFWVPAWWLMKNRFFKRSDNNTYSGEEN